MRPVICLLVLVMAACGSSAIEDFCDRAESCDALRVDADTCVETFEDAFDPLSDSEREEAERLLQTCVDRSTCDGFVECLDDLASAAVAPAMAEAIAGGEAGTD